MITKILWAAYLVPISVMDLRKKSVPTVWVVGGCLFASVLVIVDCFPGQVDYADRLLGIIPGLALLGLAKLTGKAGEADGIVLGSMGAVFGWRGTWAAFFFSVQLLFIVSIVLLFLRKKGRDTKIPYFPFLLAGTILSILGGVG